jgi:hypothetical protein
MEFRTGVLRRSHVIVAHIDDDRSTSPPRGARARSSARNEEQSFTFGSPRDETGAVDQEGEVNVDVGRDEANAGAETNTGAGADKGGVESVQRDRYERKLRACRETITRLAAEKDRLAAEKANMLSEFSKHDDELRRELVKEQERSGQLQNKIVRLTRKLRRNEEASDERLARAMSMEDAIARREQELRRRERAQRQAADRGGEAVDARLARAIAKEQELERRGEELLVRQRDFEMQASRFELQRRERESALDERESVLAERESVIAEREAEIQRADAHIRGLQRLAEAFIGEGSGSGPSASVATDVEEDVCCICLDPLSTNTVTQMQNCIHILHEQCFLRHIEANTSGSSRCPICRAPV